MEYPYLNQSLQLSFVGFSQIISYLINAQKLLDTKERYTRLNPHQDLSELAYAPPDAEARSTSKEFDSLLGKDPAEIINVDALRKNFAQYLADASTPIPVLTNPDLYRIQVVDLRKLPMFQLILTTPKMGLNLLNKILGFDKFDRNATVHPAVLNLLSSSVRQELEDYLSKQVPNERAKTISALDGLYRLTQLNLQLLAYGQAEIYEHATIVEPTVSLATDWKIKVDAAITYARSKGFNYGLINMGYFQRDSRSFMELDYIKNSLGLNVEEQLMFHFNGRRLEKVTPFEQKTFEAWNEQSQKDPQNFGLNFMFMHGRLGETNPKGRGATGYILNLRSLHALDPEYTPRKFNDSDFAEQAEAQALNVQKAIQFSQQNSKTKGEIFSENDSFNRAWAKLKTLLSWDMLQAMSASFPLIAKVNPNIIGFNRPILNYSQQIFIYNKRPAFYVSFYEVKQNNSLKRFLVNTPQNINWVLRPLTTLRDFNLEYRDDNFEDSYRRLGPEVLELTFSVKELFKRVLANNVLKEDDYIFITNTHQHLPAEAFNTINNFLTRGQAERAFRTPLDYEVLSEEQITKVSSFANTAVTATGEHTNRLSRKNRRQLDRMQHGQDLNAKIEKAIEQLHQKDREADKVHAHVESQREEISVKDYEHNEELSLLDLIKQQDAKEKARDKKRLAATVDNSMAETAYLGQVLEQHVKPESIKQHITGIESNVPLILADGYTNNFLFKLVNKSRIPAWDRNRVSYPQVATASFFSLPSFVTKPYALTGLYPSTKVVIPGQASGKPQATLIKLLNQTNQLTLLEREQLQHFLRVQKENNQSPSIQFEKFAFVPADLWEELKASQHEVIRTAYQAKQNMQVLTGELEKDKVYSEADFASMPMERYVEMAQELGMKHFITPASAKVESYLSHVFETTNRKYGPFPYQLIKAPKIDQAELERIKEERQKALELGYRVVTVGQRLYYAAPEVLPGIRLLYLFAKYYHVAPYHAIEHQKVDGAIIEEDIQYDSLSIWLDYAKLYTTPISERVKLLNRNLLAQEYHYDTTPRDSNRLLQFLTESGLTGNELNFMGYNTFSPLAGLTRPYHAQILVPVQTDPVPAFVSKVTALQNLIEGELDRANQEFQYLLALQQAIEPWSTRYNFLATGYRYPEVNLALHQEYLNRVRPQLDKVNQDLLMRVLVYYQAHQEIREDIVILDSVAAIPQQRTLDLQMGNESLAFNNIPQTWVISKGLIRQSAAIWQEPDWHIGKILQLVAANQRIAFLAQSPVRQLPLEQVVEQVQVFNQQYQTPSVSDLLSWAHEHNFGMQSISQLPITQDDYVAKIALTYHKKSSYTPAKVLQAEAYHLNVNEVANTPETGVSMLPSFFEDSDEERKGLTTTTGFLDTDFGRDEEHTSYRQVETTSYYRDDQEGEDHQASQKLLEEVVAQQPRKSKGAWWKFGLFSDDDDEQEKLPSKETKGKGKEVAQVKEAKEVKAVEFKAVAVKTLSFDANPSKAGFEGDFASGSPAKAKVKSFDPVGGQDDFGAGKASGKATIAQAFGFTGTGNLGVALVSASKEEIISGVKAAFGGRSLIRRAQRYVERKLANNEAFISGKRGKGANKLTVNFDLGVKISPSSDYENYLKRLDRDNARLRGMSIKEIELQELRELDNLVKSSVFAAYPRLEQQAADVGIITNNRNTPQTLQQLKVKVLNLDTQFYRWEGMFSQLKTSIVASVQRIEGVRGDELSEKVIDDNFAQDKFILFNRRPATPREIGAALAHRKALLSALYDESIDQNDFVLICEDDIVFSPDWQVRLTRILQQATNEPIDAITLLHPKIYSDMVYPIELHNAKVINLSSWRYISTPDLPQLVEFPLYRPISSACYLVRKSAICRAVQQGVLDQVGAQASDLANFLNIWPDRIRLAIPTLAHNNNSVNTMDSLFHGYQKMGAIYCFTNRKIIWK
ncbi:hypothetical protein CJP74_01525 [Psittacicella melopsittaci]|uniref:Glycosyl transferase family 25 domain-containing protein n=1 Tax=Psittacicella melopsittaci TaxID=2028576 RepID=A0A3A1Y5N3_9GAMM|nr:glycosyltransferase family 25 protein [Psittacicella melopsittaci]RIY33572.1 hypothetical protein CJP74_01525 [Psittacicella melopsittaci]